MLLFFSWRLGTISGNAFSSQTLWNASGMNNLTCHFLHIVGIRGEILLGWNVQGVFLAVIMCNACGILADRNEIVLHALDIFVDIHTQLLVINRIVRSILLRLLGIFILMDVRHGGLVDIKDRIHVFTRVDLVLCLIGVSKSIVFCMADFILRIVFVDILIEVLPNERDSFLTFLYGLTAVMGLIEHRVDVGLEVAVVTVHDHDKCIDWSNPQ